ncbi:E3 ubiquitin-protein ligase SNT2 [Madurella mycetomatis]|uniref:E3 ubiquitin-protein ligase SNT2 n=1 Tax=Madurella mycetomatis TaxID=100816 RepID=A0A175W278_9PEZI|nr:E3 ubiquitin-protein ligase SNT2 [Madurella mycetomatis]
MAQKSQTANQSEDQATSGSRNSSAKDGAGATSPTRQSANSANSGAISPSVLPRMSDPTPISASNSESPQPMGKPSAAGSQASPYGTRSRNRTGAARPNYAEDKDIDADIFDVYPQRKDDDSKKASTRQQQAASTGTSSSSTTNATQAAPRSGNGSSRKPLPDDNRQNASSSGTKDQHQNSNQLLTAAASAASASAAATTAASSSSSSSSSSVAGGNAPANGASKGKKRKATDTASAASGSQTPSASNGTSSSSALQKRLGSAGQGSGNATPSGSGYSETNMLTFENCKARPKDGKMVADDGTVLEVNDHVYLVCEPPGEPYYLGRIMEFLHVKNDPTLPIDALRINWYYRPKDIGRKVQDTRLVFATMHSDISPLTSLRGKCQIRHKAEIQDMAAYKRSPDCFWYEKLYDRYIQKNYEVIPTSQVINVPEHVKKVLDERWKFVLTEQGRGKELTSAVKTCKRCSSYCANNDSVDCAVCQHTYHMNCVKPPLLKKPSRGFAWSCAACSRAQERKLEARNTPNVSDANFDAEDDEALDDEDEEMGGVDGVDTGRTSRTSPAEEGAHPPPTAEQIYHASLWPYRYLGMHCKAEDALDLDDRIFPRASTRLGPRHQAVVLPWFGRPVRYVKPLEFKKTGRNNNKLTKEQQAALEAERIERERRPKWIQDQPAGYVERGGDDTSTLLYKPPEDCGVRMSSEALDDYMDVARSMAVSLGLPPHSTNLQDVARDLLFRNGFDPEKAIKELSRVPKAEFKEPELTPAEQKKFEEGVAKFGSELHSVMKHVKTLSPATVTRWYYTWKKTERGKQVWGNFSGRKGKKDAKKAEAAANKLADDVADDHDDSAFDAEKAKERKKGFICKFCGVKKSRQWRRAPAAAVTPVTENGGRNNNKDKKDQYIQALCRRCAELWRRYAIQWEDIDEVAKKVAQTGGRGWRRKVDEELYKELLAADEMMNNTRFPTPDPAATASPAGSSSTQVAPQEPPRKKLKGWADKDAERTPSESGSVSAGPVSRKKAVEKQQPPLPIPEIPKPRTLPCAICREMEPLGDQHLSCRECRLTVHRNCYGVLDNRAPGKWTCDMCLNDKNPQLSIHYKCVLCPVDYTEHEFVEPPKISSSHKKKTEKERERERVERENAQKAADYYRKKQEEMNRPVNPREPLKRTADNNWVHVTCAVWTPEVKFGNAKTLAPSEGVPLIPRERYGEVCEVCKKEDGACVDCHQCHTAVHVECAHQAGYVLGFDVTPVKGSRRDQFRIVAINGESGVMSAAVWCKEHVPTKTIVHRMHDIVAENGMNALQLYVQNYKQADLTLTGCARKANQITVASKMSTSPSVPVAQNRRASLVALANGDHGDAAPGALQPGGKICLTCGVDVSPKWHPIDQAQERELTNGYFGSLGSEAQKFVEQRSFQCHKCKKAGRQPNPHPQPPKEPTPPPEPVRQASQAAAAAVLPPVGSAEARHPSRGPYGWSAPAPCPFRVLHCLVGGLPSAACVQ